MADFSVVTNKLKGSAEEISGISGTVCGYGSRVTQVRGRLNMKGSAGIAIRKSLSELASGIEKQGNKVKKASSALSQIASLYETTESRITETKSDSGKADGEDTGGGRIEIDSWILPIALIPGVQLVDPSLVWTKLLNLSDTTQNTMPSGEAAVFSGKAEGSGTIFGFDSAGEASGSFLGASYKTEYSNGVKWKKDEKTGDMKLDDVSLIAAAVSGEVHLAKGKAKGNIGLLNGEISGTVGEVSAKGEVSASLIKDGKLRPQLSAEAEVSATAAKGDATVALGSENNDVHAKAEGKLGYAKASAQGGLGYVSSTDANGNETKGYGISGSVSAEAYAAQGKVSGGVKIFGIEIDVGITGKAGGVGASAGGSVTTGGVSGSASLGVGLGLGIDISIDWSGFKFGW